MKKMMLLQNIIVIQQDNMKDLHINKKCNLKL